jgi:hypothetical protein
MLILLVLGVLSAGVASAGRAVDRPVPPDAPAGSGVRPPEHAPPGVAPATIGASPSAVNLPAPAGCAPPMTHFHENARYYPAPDRPDVIAGSCSTDPISASIEQALRTAVPEDDERETVLTVGPPMQPDATEELGECISVLGALHWAAGHPTQAWRVILPVPRLDSSATDFQCNHMAHSDGEEGTRWARPSGSNEW